MFDRVFGSSRRYSETASCRFHKVALNPTAQHEFFESALYISQLHDAAASEDLASINKFLEEGMDPNVQTRLAEKIVCATERATPLHFWALAIGNLPNEWVLKALVTKGAHLEAKDENGQTPLDLAIAADERFNLARITMLLKWGAKLSKLSLLHLIQKVEKTDRDITIPLENLVLSQEPVFSSSAVCLLAVSNIIELMSHADFYVRQVSLKDMLQKAKTNLPPEQMVTQPKQDLLSFTQNPDIEKIMQRLSLYIERVEQSKSTKSGQEQQPNFAFFKFPFFKTSRGLNRRSNYEYAKWLYNELQSRSWDFNTREVFAETFSDENLLKHRIKRNCIKSIHSSELNKIIKDAKSINRTRRCC